MYALSIRFILPAGTDWDSMRSLLKQRAELYLNVPGLISKAFILNPESSEYGGNYLWESREALEAFLNSELFAGAVHKLGQPQQINIYEVVAYIEREDIHA